MIVLKEQAESYEELEQALEDGRSLQISTINQNGSVFQWNDADKVNRAFPPNRYRIVKPSEGNYDKAT